MTSPRLVAARLSAARVALAGCIVLALVATAAAVDRETRDLARDADSFKRSDAARALGREGSPEAAALLLELLGDDNPYVRDHTVQALGKLKTDESIAAAAKGVRHRDPLFRANLASGLGRTASPAALEALVKLAGDREARVRAAVADSLWGFRDVADEAAVERLTALLAEAASDDEPAVRAAAVEAVGRVRLPGCVEAVRKALNDEDAGVRAVAGMELFWVEPDAASAELATAAQDPEWCVRAQAVDNAFALRSPAAIDVLIGRLADERERVAAAAHRALIGLTGKELGRDVEIWTSWWDVNRDGWSAPGDAEMGEPKDDGGTRASYHGLAVDSGHVVFVLDASGSMREPAGDGTRWDLAVAELSKAVDALPDEAQVNVIVFQEKVRACFDAPRGLSKKVRKDLVAFARRVSPGESGDLLAGMLLALEQENADTVFLLSDGAPSHGEIVVKDRARAAIRARNRRSKLVVNAVGLGAEKRTERSFLSGVVRDAGGRVVFR